ncbi:hypothetical protein PanWU01x14_210320 [Parasponia andersonii]|uniref:Uncharacterized protein n=1 Tax=Parasponia andersonii TaxID=3476 RepID=A0A2P5BU52_PARAD|nr:hypothetical protein PanWU01x14_210320 [Parasponia andersonii]
MSKNGSFHLWVELMANREGLLLARSHDLSPESNETDSLQAAMAVNSHTTTRADGALIGDIISLLTLIPHHNRRCFLLSYLQEY